MKIETQHIYPPIPLRQFDWCAVDGETYDGAPDSNHPIGYGPTEQAAISDLLEQIEDAAYDPRTERHFHLDAFDGTDICKDCGLGSLTEIHIRVKST